MRNPLLKRLPRELFGEFGKYAAIFLFMLATIGLVSGFLVTSGSIKKTYNESFEKYNIEDGHFVLDKKPDKTLLEKIEEEDITLYEDFYVEQDVDVNGDKKRDSTLRIYGGEREEINGVCLMSGVLPENANEIALDRMYAENNEIEVGDTIRIGNLGISSGKEFKVCGLIALPDYSALFQDNNDMMFDAKMFGVAVVTEEAFAEFDSLHLYYCYGWKYKNKPEDDIKEKEVSEELAETIVIEAMKDGKELKIFIPGFLNSAIHFTDEDMESDRPMMTILLYMMVIIMAFVFAVTINHTVAKEATVIGTLRASGYTKGELFRHYLTTPLLITLLAAILGNVAGYTVFVDVVKGIYFGSYSYTTYESVWSSEAFVMTTVVPMLIMVIVISVSLWRKLSFTPLQFIRRDITKRRREKAVKLPHFRFFTRFRLRILLQNVSGYLILFIGILFAGLLLVFGMGLPPMLENYGRDAVEYMPADYQYIINTESSVPSSVAEKYCVTSLRMQDDFFDEETINVYGLVKNSEYFDMEMPEKGVVITSDLAEKYRLEEGNIVNLKEQYGDKLYAFEVSGILHYPTSLSIYMSKENFNEAFDKESSYYNGYFSDTKLEEDYLEEENIVRCITEEDVTKVSRQLEISMGGMMNLVKYFAIAMFALLVYLLTKLILEKNTTSISMVKILGYENSEIARLYLISSVWVVVVSSIFALYFNTWMFREVLLRPLLKSFGGWLNLVISQEYYVQMFLMMVGAYLLVALLQFFKIKRIPMDEALKNVE